MSAAPHFNEVRSVSKRGTLTAVFWFLVTVAVSVPCAAAQEPYPLELTWEAPQGCPQLDEVEEQIRTLVSGLTDGQWQSSLRARGTIVPNAQRFELTLVIQQGQASGRRVIASEDCQSLGKAAAVVLGLLIRKERLGRELSELEISGGTDQPTPGDPHGPAAGNPLPSAKPDTLLPPSSQPLAPAPAKPVPSAWSLTVIAPNLVLDAGTLPHPSYGAGLGAGVFIGHWRVFASGNLWLSQSTRPFEGHVFEAVFRRQSADFTACYALSLHEAFEVGPCTQFAFDRVSGEASGGRLQSRSNSSLLFSGGAGIGAFWRFGRRTALLATATGRVATHRPTFVLETPFGSDGVHTIPALSAVASFGFMWIF